ncbi:HNH endonuclease signature motif containing protein [Streptomyces xanthophaeus]
MSGPWLRGSGGNAGKIPGQVAESLRGWQFQTFDEFRKAFWTEVSKAPELASQFTPSNQTAMRNGNAPFGVDDQRIGGNNRYVLHHVKTIQHGGGVYDLDNLIVATPVYHREVLDPSCHMGNGQ